MSRPASEVAQARQDTQWCLHQLHIRRWRYSVIADRLHVSRSTVYAWRRGTRSPRTEPDMQRLIGLTRMAMHFPPVYERVTGMMVVVESLRAALGLSYRGLGRRLEMSESRCLNWRFFGYQPGRAATLRLRALVREAHMPNSAELLNLCDRRLAQIGNETNRRRERFRRLREMHFNRDSVSALRKLVVAERGL